MPNPCFPRPQIPRHQNSTPTSPPRLKQPNHYAAQLLLPNCPVVHHFTARYTGPATTVLHLPVVSSELKKLNLSRCSIRQIAHHRTPPSCPIPLGAFPVEKKEGKENKIKHHACDIPAPKVEQSLPCSFTKKCPKRRQRQHWRSAVRLSSLHTTAQEIIVQLRRPQLQQRVVDLTENTTSSTTIHPNRLYPPFPLPNTQWPTKSSSASSSENGNTYGQKRSSTSGSSS